MSEARVYLSRAKKKLLKATFWAVDAVADSDHFVRYTYRMNGYHTPDYRFDKREIMFVHLPKTGGTSIARILANDPKSRFVQLDIHKPISVHCPPVDFKYITVLRDPVARVWSYYQMVLRNPEGYPYKNYAVRGLEPFLAKCWAARNMACRYLTGRVEEEPTHKSVEESLANLKAFHAVLLFDHFSAEVEAFAKAHDIPCEAVPNERKASYSDPTAEEVALICRFNEHDIALFERWKTERTTEGSNKLE